tara:strand:- start:497 stop:604 length:108 start_codon:yes stop_codon:yes gene_type:complete
MIHAIARDTLVLVGLVMKGPVVPVTLALVVGVKAA